MHGRTLARPDSRGRVNMQAFNLDAMPTYQFSCEVLPQYLPEQSEPDNHLFAFSYTVTITNTGDVAAQLIARHWFISDANGHNEEVKGLGVVGHQPLLKPGEQFEYTSWAQIATPQGSMQGRLWPSPKTRTGSSPRWPSSPWPTRPPCIDAAAPPRRGPAGGVAGCLRRAQHEGRPVSTTTWDLTALLPPPPPTAPPPRRPGHRRRLRTAANACRLTHGHLD